MTKDVKHVPELRRNLISIGKLVSEGCAISFMRNSWKVIKGSLVIEKGQKVGTLHSCTTNVDNSISLFSMGMDTTLWNHRLGNMSKKMMQILHSKNLLSNLKHSDLDFCEKYVYGKWKIVIFLKVGKEK
jgi:hypothetical protein